MSGHDNEDLIDYDDDHDITNVGAISTTNGATTSAVDMDEKDKKNFSGIHSTGFRYFFHMRIMLIVDLISQFLSSQRFSS
jgi:ATP-dependent RNA helicase UAP56/SUB2